MERAIKLVPSLTAFGVMAFFAFLIVEPFKPELLALFSVSSLEAWPTFALTRFTLLGAAIALVFFGLASSVAECRRCVPMPTPGNDPLLTLRAFACILVLAGHGFVVVFAPSGIADRLLQGSHFWLAMGSPWVGVWVFFVLSGYLMAKGFYRGNYSLSRSSVWRFYKNRLLRIVPIYYTVLFVAAVFSSPQIFLPSNSWQIVALGLFSQQNQAPTPVIGALWSIQTEMAFYAMVPVLFMALDKICRSVPVWIPIALLLIAGVAYRVGVMAATLNMGWLDRVYVPLVSNLDLFMLGMLTNWVLPAVKQRLKSLPALPIALIILIFSYFIATFFFVRAVYGPHNGFYSWCILVIGPTMAATITFCVILLCESHVEARREASFAPRYIVRATQRFGILTYALYVWHEPIFLRIRSIAGDNISTSTAIRWVLMAIALTIIAASVTYRLIEAPLEKKKPNMSPEPLHPIQALERAAFK